MKIIISVLATISICGCGSNIDTPRVRVNPSSSEHAAEVEYRPGKAIINIYSQRGIGKATVIKDGEVWPERIVFRLHLKGLEFFSISNRREMVKVSVQSKMPFRSSCIHHGREKKDLTRSDPLWVQTKIIVGEGKKPAIPLRGGFFRVVVPAAMMKDNPVALNIEWIDFYR